MSHRILLIAVIGLTALGCKSSSSPSTTRDGPRPDTGPDVTADTRPTDTAPAPADRPDAMTSTPDGPDAATCSGLEGSLPRTWRYLTPGCGANAPTPICASYQMDACARGYICDCDGKLHVTCDGWLTAPWAYVRFNGPDAGGEGAPCDPNAMTDGGPTAGDASEAGTGQ